jgi:hypothetical protein
LVVRNIYAPYINSNASEREYVLLGRITGSLVIVGAVSISLSKMDVFEQLKLTWVFPVLFAAPFWIGMYWRRATTTAAWCSVAFCTLMFFLIPFLTPLVFPQLRDNVDFLTTTQFVQTTSTRPAAPSDVRQREVQIAQWKQRAADADTTDAGPCPETIQVGDTIQTEYRRGGESVFWGDGVKPIDPQGNVLDAVALQPVSEPFEKDGHVMVPLGYGPEVQLKGFGNFRLDFLIYKWLGIDLSKVSNATLGTLELVPKIVFPFLVMIFFSLITKRNSQYALDRYYAKMKTPVVPDREQDERNLVSAYADPRALDSKKMFPDSDFEFQKPAALDVIGFLVSVAVCFAIIGAAAFAASIGK